MSTCHCSSDTWIRAMWLATVTWICECLWLTSFSTVYLYWSASNSHLCSALEQTCLNVNIDDLHDYNREFADRLLKQPSEFIPTLDDTLLHVYNADKHEIENKRYCVGFSRSFGDHHVSSQTLQAAHLGKMISLEGIITRCSLVRPKMLVSVHYCPETRQFHQREYRDATSSSSHLPPTTS
jgi:DNA replication licensing factor MCM3